MIINTQADLTRVAEKLQKILPRVCPRKMTTQMYARYFLKGGKWIFYIGACTPFEEGDPIFWGYSTGKGDGWMAFALSHWRMGVKLSQERSYSKGVIEIMRQPKPLSEILLNRGKS